MTDEKVHINVQELTNDPTLLWDKLKLTQNQEKLLLKDFTENVSSEKKPGYVRFVLISDTHNHEIELPEGDILLHGGDFTKRGKPQEIEDFNNFLGKVKHKFEHIIVICGNHELTFDPSSPPAKEEQLEEVFRNLDHKEMKSKLTNCRYVEDETVEIMGFKIYGSPWQPVYNGWAYNLERGEQCLEKWNLIPNDTDILLTHAPPLGYGDLCFSRKRAGCAELLSTVQQRVKPILHVFGHIHEGYGIWTDRYTTFVNASTCAMWYRPINRPIVIDLQPNMLLKFK